MSTRIRSSKHGRELGIGQKGEILAPGGFAAGSGFRPTIYFPSADRVALFEDFLGDDVTDTGSLVSGIFNQLRGSTAIHGHQALTNGVWRFFRTDGATFGPSNGGGLNTNLFWKANQGKGTAARDIRMAARVKLESVSRDSANIHVFVGFTDNLSAECPIYDTGAGIISPATDAVGIIFSPGGDTGWFGAAVRNDTDVGPVVLDTGVAANTYDDLEVVLRRSPGDTGGRADFYINGRIKGTISSPVTSSVSMTPLVYAWNADTGAGYVDLDWIAVSGTRDTGE